MAVFLFYFGLAAINLVLINIAAKAARRKNRSYGAFWWLGLVLSPFVTFVIVAILPFNEYDARSPITRIGGFDENQPHWTNKHVAEPSISKSDKGWFTAGVIALAIGVISAVMAIFDAASSGY